MKKPSTKVLSSALYAGALLLLVVGCSSSGFEGSSASKKSEDNASTTAGASADSSNLQETKNGASTSSQTAFTNDAFNPNEAAEGDPVGCRLPDAVNAKLSKAAIDNGTSTSTGGSKGGNWGGGGGANFMNLDVSSCSWFQAAKADNAYILVFHDKAKQQTYAQRFPGPGNPINWAVCLTSAAAGGVSCEFLP